MAHLRIGGDIRLVVILFVSHFHINEAKKQRWLKRRGGSVGGPVQAASHVVKIKDSMDMDIYSILLANGRGKR